MMRQIDDIRHGRDDAVETSGHRTVFHSLLDSSLMPPDRSNERLSDEAFSLITAGFATTYVLFVIWYVRRAET